MKKKVLSLMLVLSLVMSIFLVGCGGGGGNEEPAEDAIKVALVTNQKFGDNGPMDDLASGAERAVQDFGVEIKKLESSQASFEEDIRAMSADYDLVITTFPYMTDATILVSQEFPETNYAAIFQFINLGETSYPNIWDTEFHGEGAFYLCGYMAGKATQTNRIGMLIGGEEPSPNAEGNAFMQGAKAANPDITVDFAYVGSYEDPAKAKEFAKAMIDKGCDFIQNDAGASNAGAVEAAKEAGIMVAGEITDYYSSYNGFTGVCGIGFGNNAYAAIEALVNGDFPGGQHGIEDLANGGYYMKWDTYERFAEANTKYGPALKTAIEEAKAIEGKILDGSFKVEFDTAVPNWERIKNM